MNYLDELKSISNIPQGTDLQNHQNPNKVGFVGFAGALLEPIEKNDDGPSGRLEVSGDGKLRCHQNLQNPDFNSFDGFVGTGTRHAEKNGDAYPGMAGDESRAYSYFYLRRDGRRIPATVGTPKTLQDMADEHPDCTVEINRCPPDTVGGPTKAADAHFCWRLTWPYGHSVTEVTIPALTAAEMKRLNPAVTCEPFQPQRPAEQAPPEIQQHLCELVFAGKLTDDECDFACIYWNCWPEQDWRCRWLRHLKGNWS